MNDPHVEALLYDVLLPSRMDATDVEQFTWTTPSFCLRLTGARAEVLLSEHFSDEERARGVIEPTLRAYEICAGLELGAVLRFDFVRARVVERAVTPEQPDVLTASIHDDLRLRDHVEVTVNLIRYPTPASQFSATPLVETLWFRYGLYLQGRELLQSMVYFCVTAIEAAAGGQRAARAQFKISSKVLSKMRQISSSRGDERTARKWNAGAPLSQTESDWLDASVRQLIAHLGTWAADHSVRTLTMADLPPI